VARFDQSAAGVSPAGLDFCRQDAGSTFRFTEGCASP